MYVKPLTVLLIFCSAVSAEAQVYKCKAADGSITYQQIPCPKGDSQSVPKIQKAPTLTEKEKLNAAAYAAGMTPQQPRQPLSGQGRPIAPVPYMNQYDHQQDRRRIADCNERYDEVVKQAKSNRHVVRGLSFFERHRQSIENDRANCINGSGVPGQTRSSLSPSQNIGQCQSHCSSEQGICIANCNGNGSCIGNCSASHGRCVAACSY